jgi:hypothetical protein
MDSEAGPRVVTVLFYLSDVEEGGETAFPLVEEWMHPEQQKRYGPYSECAKGKLAVKPRKVCVGGGGGGWGGECSMRGEWHGWGDGGEWTEPGMGVGGGCGLLGVTPSDLLKCITPSPATCRVMPSCSGVYTRMARRRTCCQNTRWVAAADGRGAWRSWHAIP